MSSEIPKEFICPITLSIMRDPVMMPDGHNYERSAIEKALQASPLSPLTKQPLNMKDAIPNYDLKSLIEKFLKIGKMPEMPKNSAKIGENSLPQINSFKAEVIPNPTNTQEVFVNLTIEPKKIEKRKPLLLISMIDVSGSMSDSASEIKGNDEEEGCFSRLALVKHSLKTVVSTLSENDKMCLITFNGKAKTELEATNADDEGKKRIIDKIEKMHANGSTNIWDALRLGIEVSKRFVNYSIYLMLFTDGEPNVNPPLGIVPSLKETISNIKNVNFTISTFAFGYEVDSELMEEIAKVGNGIYGYCPDCTMVGTIFVNFMANILNTIESTVKIDVKNKKLNKKFEIGGLYSGTSRHLGFFLDNTDFKNTEIALYLGPEKKNDIKGIDLTEKNDEIMDQYFRYRLINLLEEIISTKNKNEKENLTKVKDLYEEINKIEKKTDFMNNLLIDLIHENDNHGQVEKAIRPEYFKRWGLDYLLSFLRFHVTEQCGNFKDQSLKKYSNKEFEKLQKEGNKIFISLPAPENDLHYGKGYNISQSNFADMCYNAYGGCFTGDAFVELKNGKKKVKNLKKGEILSNGAEVVCVVENKINKYENVVCINDVCFSLYHPIEIEGKWVFPCQCFKVQKKFVDSWYNLVLKNKHEVVLNGIKAITLGHNRKEGILKHPYFGTNKVIEALMKYNTYEKGFISTSNLKVHRSNNLIDEYY